MSVRTCSAAMSGDEDAGRGARCGTTASLSEAPRIAEGSGVPNIAWPLPRGGAETAAAAAAAASVAGAAPVEARRAVRSAFGGGDLRGETSGLRHYQG